MDRLYEQDTYDCSQVNMQEMLTSDTVSSSASQNTAGHTWSSLSPPPDISTPETHAEDNEHRVCERDVTALQKKCFVFSYASACVCKFRVCRQVYASGRQCVHVCATRCALIQRCMNGLSMAVNNLQTHHSQTRSASSCHKRRAVSLPLMFCR